MQGFVSILSASLAALAENYAKDTGCIPVDHNGWEKLPAGATVTVFGQREDITPRDFYRARRLGDAGVDVGFLTGRTYAQIEQLAVRNREKLQKRSRQPFRSLTLDPLSSKPSDYRSDRWVLRGHEASQQKTWTYLLEAPCELLTIISHGRDNNIYLADSTICGRAQHVQHPQNRDTHLPACYFGHPCYKDKPLVMANELPVGVVFLNSCFGLKTQDATFHGDYALALGFIEGSSVTHVVASDSMQPGHPWYNELFSRLFEEGWPIGRVVAEVNAFSARNRLDISRFNLLGDPRYCWILSGAPTESNPSRDESRSIILNDVTNSSSQTSCDTANFESEAVALGRRIRALQGIPNLRLAIPEMPGRLVDLQRRFHHFSENYRASLYREVKEASITKSIRTLTKSCDILDQQVLDYLADKTNRHNFHLVENYREQTWVGSESETSCPGCGGWALAYMVREYFDMNPFRRLIDCPQCGVVQDTPPDPLVTVNIAFQSTIEKGATWAIAVTICSQAPWPIPVRVRACVSHGFRRGIQFTMNPDAVVVAAGSSQRVVASTTIPEGVDLREHNYWLRVYTMANSDLYFDHRNFWVVREGDDD
ncbi:MAG: hypothetical protein C7B47_14760 [Sulfobacillus thermosulfidooxidans]|uniref:Uncharacterized protein n=1 Tax=Sulfobacillus thermosulfidooxidans TaxID=28034 RepID=A0A2T2WQE1_SULTH|nr:MAG: hypothetical protein C7B47_14760 [Sulfobacillus thermosulfidooxidans]